MTLKEIIIKKIADQSALSFHDFMEMCLYYPNLGYFTAGRNRIGREGDFYTSPCLTPVFGAMIGKQLEEMWAAMGCAAFTIVEYGAGDGRLCFDILNYLQQNKAFYKQLNYYIIEKNAASPRMGNSHLAEKVTWCNSAKEIPVINGCIFSNELLDNFAIHPVLMGEELLEAYITYENGFKEIWMPATHTLKAYLEELNITLPAGFRMEINIGAVKWIEEMASLLSRGFILTIDYGFLSSEFLKQSRSEGTLISYRNHLLSDNLYDHLGDQDITAHVNFSSLIHWGEKAGLRTCGYTDQCQFLLGLGFKQALENSFSKEGNILQAARQISMISHTLLYDMGTKYKVLIQKKGMGEVKLSGLIRD